MKCALLIETNKMTRTQKKFTDQTTPTKRSIFRIQSTMPYSGHTVILGIFLSLPATSCGHGLGPVLSWWLGVSYIPARTCTTCTRDQGRTEGFAWPELPCCHGRKINSRQTLEYPKAVWDLNLSGFGFTAWQFIQAIP